MLRRVGIAATLGALVLPAAAGAAPGMLSIEGTFSYVEVKDSRGHTVLRRSPARRHLRMLRHLSAGVYRVSAGRRAARCARRVHVFSRGLTQVRVSAHVRRACTMTRHALPARFPSRRRIRAVQRYLRARGAVNSWSVIDSWGRLHGFAPHRVYVSASLVKAMLLTSYLRGLGNRMPDAAERSVLGPMITVSSNDAADTIYYRVGDAALYRLAKAVGMKGFSVAGYWANAHFSAEDQARLFNRIDRLIPPRSRAYARGLLSSIVSYQRWGFSRFAGAAGFRTFFKGGWRGTGLGQLVHEAALFERRGTRFSMAVLTDGNPSHEYGTETLQGVAQRVFGARANSSDEPVLGGTPATRRAGLVDVHKYAPSIRVNLSYRTKHNETGKPLPGYCENWALMHDRAAFSLGQVQRYLRPRNRGLLVLDAYRTKHNETGKPLPGYCENWALMHDRAAFTLGQVQRYLRRRNRGLLVFDAYRPVRATEALVRWAQRTGRGGAVGTYIARRSRHNTGSATDITLVRDSDGKRLRMGGFAFGPSSHTYNARGPILANRLELKNAMERFGFSAYLNEWWHFEHRIRPNRYLDVTLGCGRHN